MSNFWIAPIELDGKIYPSVEHFYQACKAPTEELHDQIRICNSPSKAKRLGQSVELPDDWNGRRDIVMVRGVEAKFEQNYDLGTKLIATKRAYLEETNHWNDTYWGVCNGKGKNVLGNILMNTRNKIWMDRILT